MSLRIWRTRNAVVAAFAGALGLTGSLLAGVPAAAAEERLELGLERASKGQRAPGADKSVESAGGSVGTATYAQGATRRDGTVSSVNGAQSGTAAQQISSARVTQDLVGQRLRAVATYKATPSAGANSVIEVYYGEWYGSTCRLRAAIVGAATGGPGAGYFFNDSGQTGSFGASSSRSGNVVTITSAVSGTFRNADYDCTWARVRHPEGSATAVFQNFFAADLTTTYIPKLSIAGGEPVKGNYKGKWVNLRLEVENTGRGDAGNVRVKASGSRLTIKPRSRNLGTVKGRSSKYGVNFKVKLKGSKSRKIRFTVTASGGHKATKSFTIAQKPRAKKYKSLSGRYFWGHLPANSAGYSGWENNAIWFVNKRWAYVGFPKGSAKPKCRRASKTCKRYTYNARTGRVKIGKQRFRVTTEGFRYKAKSGEAKGYYYPLTLPRKNTKLSADLIHQDWSGYCVLTCTSSTERITLGKNGRFVRSSYSIGSWPGIGQNWSVIPADKRGTYRIIGKGRIEFRYANGKKKREVIGIEHDVRGRPSPAGAGLVIGDTNFYFQD